jgi:galactose-1-phosphate uridylyltransferase
MLCVENEGYMGRVNHPARQNHRIVPITINNTPWMLQFSPYVYYNEHCICFNTEHTPMAINTDTFVIGSTLFITGEGGVYMLDADGSCGGIWRSVRDGSPLTEGGEG